MAELDTTHFKGNAPGEARLTGIDDARHPVDGADGWFGVLPRTRLQPDTRHRFRLAGPAVTHVRMDVYPDGSGLAFAGYGVGPFASGLIAAAGYMGTPVWGVAMLLGARSSRSTRAVLAGLGLLLAGTALFAVSNRFGQTAIAITGASVILVAAAPRRIAYFVAQLIGAQACVNAVLDIRVLFRPALVVDGSVVGASDAHAMARATVGTADKWAVWMWAGIWLAWSLVLFFVALRRLSARDAKTTTAAAAPPQ